jgi:hypothetical protein
MHRQMLQCSAVMWGIEQVGKDDVTRPTGQQRVGRWRVAIGAAALGVAALGVRVWGIGWSLPYVDHPDEPAVVNVVLRLVEGRLNPDFFFYPSTMLYLLAAVFRLHFWWGTQTGVYGTPLQLPATTDYLTTIPQAYMWGRVLCAALGAATVAAVAAFGGGVGRRAAVVGAMLLLVAPFAVTHAHYIAVDVPSAFTATLAVLAALGVLHHGTWRSYLVAGVAIGLAGATKYQAVLVCVATVAAHVLHWRGRSLKHVGRLGVAALLSALVFLACSPFVVLDWVAFSRDIRTLFGSYDGSHGDVQRAWPVGAYAERIFAEVLGPVPTVLALVGVVALWRTRRDVLLVLLLFPVVLLVVLLRPATHFFRNLLPLQPTLLLLAGVGAVAVWDWLRPRLPIRAAPVAGAVALLALLVPSALSTGRLNRAFALPDSRVVLGERLRAEYPGVRVATELSHPLDYNGVSQSTPVHYLPLHDLQWYRDQGFGVLVASSSARRAYAWTSDYDALRGATQHEMTVGGPASAYRGPQLDVFSTGLDSIAFDEPSTRVGGVELLGATWGRRWADEAGARWERTNEVRAGEVLGINLFWRTDTPTGITNEQLFVHLRDADDQNVAQIDIPPWRGLFPLRSWTPGKVITDALDVPLPETLAPGSYRLVLGLYDATTFARFPASRDGTPLPNDEIEIGTMTVLP